MIKKGMFVEKRKERRLKNKRILTKRINGLLLYSILLLLLVMVLAQSALVIDPEIGPLINTALWLEGEPLKSADSVSSVGGVSHAPWAVVSFKLLDRVSMPGVKLLINGREAGTFLQNEITVTVKQGDIAAIKNTDPENPVTVIVSKKSPNVLAPQINSSVHGKGVLHFDGIIVNTTRFPGPNSNL